MSPAPEDDVEQPDEAADEPTDTADNGGTSGRTSRPRGPLMSSWARAADAMQPVGVNLVNKIQQANQARMAAMIQPVIDTQHARMNALVEPMLIAERARTESLMRPLIRAEQARREAVVRPLRLFDQAQFEQLTKPVFEPLMRSIIGTKPDFSPFFDQLLTASTVSFEHLRLLEGLPDIDEATIDDLLDSDELQAAVEDFVQSAPVSDLLDEINLDAITEADAEQARTAATESIASANSQSGLSTPQLVAYFTAVYLLVVACVLSVYGYDVGKVSDVVAWPLAVLAVADYLRRRGE